jgi:hypothetical protein
VAIVISKEGVWTHSFGDEPNRRISTFKPDPGEWAWLGAADS